MSNKYINTIMQSGSANVEFEELEFGSLNTSNPLIPFGKVDQNVINALPLEEKKSFALKQALSSGLAMGLVVTGGYAFLKREKGVMHTLANGMVLSESDYIDYEDEALEVSAIVETQKPSFGEILDDNKMELAGIFAATTGALGWYINHKLMKG